MEYLPLKFPFGAVLFYCVVAVAATAATVQFHRRCRTFFFVIASIRIDSPIVLYSIGN